MVLKKLNETAMGGTQLPRLGWKSLGLKNKSMFRRWTSGFRESKLDELIKVVVDVQPL